MSKDRNYNPAARYVQSRMTNFQASCRLEGIEIKEPVPGVPLEEVVKKYMKVSEEGTLNRIIP